MWWFFSHAVAPAQTVFAWRASSETDEVRWLNDSVVGCVDVSELRSPPALGRSPRRLCRRRGRSSSSPVTRVNPSTRRHFVTRSHRSTRGGGFLNLTYDTWFGSMHGAQTLVRGEAPLLKQCLVTTRRRLNVVSAVQG